MKNYNFLFVTIDGGGNTPAMFGFANYLMERGHKTLFLSEPCLEQPVKDLNANFIPFTDYFTKSDRKKDFFQDWNATLFKNPVFERIIFGPSESVINQTINAIQTNYIDVLVVDVLLFPALIAAEFLNIPKLLVFHMPEYMPGPNRPPGNMGLVPGKGILTKFRDRILGNMMISKFNEYRPQLNKIRSNLNLKPLNNTVDLIDMADLRIIQTIRSFDFPIEPAPANVRYTGPILDDPDWVQTEEWVTPWDSSDKRPLIVISFSSTFQNQKDAIQNCIYALKNLPVKGLVTLGLAMEDEHFEISNNVRIIKSVKHSLVFPHADLVITHAGHGTVMRALANGLPLICLPMGRDQNDNALKVKLNGCGIKLSKNSKSEQIGHAIKNILNAPEYKKHAHRMKRDILANQGMDDVIQEIEKMVGDQKEQFV